MVPKNMKNMSYAFLMAVLILLMGMSTTITSAATQSNHVSTNGILSQENEKTICTSTENSFTVLFGVIITDAIITEVILWPEENYYIFFCEPLERVTVIGFGTYDSPELNERFYMKTFYNVSSIMGGSYKEMAVTANYSTLLSLHTPMTPCMLYFY